LETDEAAFEDAAMGRQLARRDVAFTPEEIG